MNKIYPIYMKRLISAIMVIICIFSIAGITVSASQKRLYQNNRVVRVGVSEFSHFSKANPDGSYSGIIIDYLAEIKKYTGWEIELVPGTAGECLEKLSSGEIDMMGTMIKSPEIVQMYGFAELSSGYSYSTLTVKKTSKKAYNSNNYDNLTGMKVAIFNKATTRKTAFEEFCKANGIVVTPVYFDDAAKWEEAFKAGTVDAQLTNSAKLRDDEEILIRFQQEPYHFAVTKGKTDIMSELNFALEQINAIKPQFEIELYEKYFGKDNLNKFTLTEIEAKYIKDKPVLRVVASPDWRPISYFDKTTGIYKGISADMCAFLEKTTGFKFEYIETKNFKESLDMLKSGEADLISGIYDTKFVTNNLDVTLSIPYMPTQTVILQKNETDLSKLEQPLLAMPYGFDYSAGLENFKIQYYDNVTDCITAVKKGNADFTAISNLAAEQYIRMEGKSGLTLIPMPNSSTRLSIALQNPTNPTLISILDKSICSLSEEHKQTMVLQNTSVENNSVTLTSFIYANPMLFIAVVAGVALIILISLYFAMSSRLKLSRILTKNAEVEANTDYLTGLHNKKHSEHLVRKAFENNEILPASAILIMDLDNFKQTNDTLGHLGGDEVLIHFAKTLKKIFCNGEILGRWGGDEFFVFVKDSGDEGCLEELAKRLCESMDMNFHYAGITHSISISVGISFARGKRNFGEMFKAADEALYEQKNGTKNGYLFEKDIENSLGIPMDK